MAHAVSTPFAVACCAVISTGWFNGDEKKTFLSVEPALSQLSFKLSGTTDVAVCTARSIEDM
jgi:hypothetical protein